MDGSKEQNGGFKKSIVIIDKHFINKTQNL